MSKTDVPKDKRVTNQMLRRFFNIEVTPKIIERATQRDSSHCAIADAIRADHPNLLRPVVDLATIRFTDSKTGVRYICLTPRVAQQFIVDFDAGCRKAVKPFWTQLRVTQAIPPADPGHAKRLASYKREAEGEKIATGKDQKPTPRRRKTDERVDPRSAPMEVRYPNGATASTMAAAPKLVGGRALPTSRFAKIRRFGVRGLKA